jgi:RimJ/RimL family protein N-acetyltransferase
VIELRGERVTIRPLRAEEIERVIQDTLPASAATGTDPAAARERMRQRLERSGEITEHGLDLGIDADGVLVGDVQARADGLPAGAFELGIGLFEQRDRRRGFGTEAIELLAAHLFEGMGARRIQLTTDVENVGMRRVAERVGFRHEGDLRGFWPHTDGDRDYAIYGMTRRDHEARPPGGHAAGRERGRGPRPERRQETGPEEVTAWT